MSEITWMITDLETNLENEFVVAAYWKATAIDGGFSATTQGVIVYDEEETEYDIIPYAEITEEEALLWVKSFLSEDIAGIENHLLEQIENQKNPPISPNLPWLN